MSLRENVKNNSAIEFFTHVKSSQLFWIISFSLLTVAGAQIAIPVKPVPFSLQTMMVVLAGAFLGAKNGAYSQLLYLFLGSIGLPVFANGALGVAYLFGPTGGYLLAFPIGAFVVGALAERFKSYFSIVAAMFTGEIIILLLGSLFLGTFYTKDISQALLAGAVIFSVWTVIKVLVAASIYFSINKKSQQN